MKPNYKKTVTALSLTACLLITISTQLQGQIITTIAGGGSNLSVPASAIPRRFAFPS